MSLQFTMPGADLYIPDGLHPREALSRTTHLAVGAHQDDLEIFAYHGIETCYRRPDQWFTGVTLTDGGGSPRVGSFAGYSDGMMQGVRRSEQHQAALIGGYAAQIQLAYPSRVLKDTRSTTVIHDLHQILKLTHPNVVYVHNPADKHDTHVASFLRALSALRRLPADQRPEQLYGCEVWRDLDWLPEKMLCALPVGAYPELAVGLLEVYESQIAGGKRYDLATLGRRTANATFHESHQVDTLPGMIRAVDLAPLLRDDDLSPLDFIQNCLHEFQADVLAKLNRFRGSDDPA